MRNSMLLEKMMKRPLLLAVVATFAAAGCSTTQPIAQSPPAPQKSYVGPAGAAGPAGPVGERGRRARPARRRGERGTATGLRPQASKADGDGYRRWWSVVPATLVLPAPQARKALPGRRALKARASRVLLVR
jgi:hypothetical protein